VEDDDEIRLYCHDTLESLGYRVLVAEDGETALAVYQDHAPIDLLLTDLVMPQTGGRELIEMLHKVTPELKTVVLTGYMGTELGELRTLGISEIVQKPFTVRMLAQVVRRVLDA
jgi:CheY-like chemotaxis protein